MTIFWTAYTTLTLTLIAWLIAKVKEANERYDDMLCKRNALRSEVEFYKTKEVERGKKRAYSMGLHDGRKTDEIYRAVQKSYKNGERIVLKTSGDIVKGEQQ